MKKTVCIAVAAFFLLCGVGFAVSASAGTAEPQRYGWQGNINDKTLGRRPASGCNF